MHQKLRHPSKQKCFWLQFRVQLNCTKKNIPNQFCVPRLSMKFEENFSLRFYLFVEFYIALVEKSYSRLTYLLYNNLRILDFSKKKYTKLTQPH